MAATRAFIGLDPAGRFLYAANEQGDAIVAFGVDARSGKLVPTGQILNTKTQSPSYFLGFSKGGRRREMMSPIPLRTQERQICKLMLRHSASTRALLDRRKTRVRQRAASQETGPRRLPSH
jgi:hypothetical protein